MTPKITEHLITPMGWAEEMCEAVKDEPCRLQDREITIDAAGDVHLCCALYDPKLSRIGHYLSMPLEDIQGFKQQSQVCSECMGCGAHAYATFLWKPWEKWKARLGNLRNKLNL